MTMASISTLSVVLVMKSCSPFHHPSSLYMVEGLSSLTDKKLHPSPSTMMSEEPSLSLAVPLPALFWLIPFFGVGNFTAGFHFWCISLFVCFMTVRQLLLCFIILVYDATEMITSLKFQNTSKLFLGELTGPQSWRKNKTLWMAIWQT